MRGENSVKIISAGNDWGGIISVLDLLILGRERVNIETVRIEEIGDLLRTVNVNMLAETQFLPNLEKALNNLERCETRVRIFVSCHLSPF